MFQRMTSLILGLFWVFFHFLYHIVTHTVEELRWSLKHLFSRLLTCFPAYSENRGLINIAYNVKLLKEEQKKMPKHLGVVVFGKEPLRPVQALMDNLKRVSVRRKNQLEPSECKINSIPDHVDLQALAKLVCYAWIADIHIVSLYDHNGYVKSNYKELLHYVHEEISHNLWVVRERTKVLPTIKFHNIPVLVLEKLGKNGYTNGVNGISHPSTPHSLEVLNICLLSSEDGKQAIVQTCKDLYNDMIHAKELTSKDIPQRIEELDEKVVDAKIKSVVGMQFTSADGAGALKTDPDLLIVLGKVISTTGFPPWQIRLTEMHWLPSLKRFDETDFLQSILKYANCHQRFGT